MHRLDQASPDRAWIKRADVRKFLVWSNLQNTGGGFRIERPWVIQKDRKPPGPVNTARIAENLQPSKYFYLEEFRKSMGEGRPIAGQLLFAFEPGWFAAGRKWFREQ